MNVKKYFLFKAPAKVDELVGINETQKLFGEDSCVSQSIKRVLIVYLLKPKKLDK